MVGSGGEKRTPWLNAITCKPLSSAYLRQGASAQPGSTDRYQQPPVHFAARRQRCRLRVTVQVQHDMFGFHYGPPTNILRLEHITMFGRGEQTRQPASVERKKKERKGKGGGRIRGGIYGLVFLGISSSLTSFFTRGKGSEPGILLLTFGKFKSFTLLILYLLGLRLALECGIYDRYFRSVLGRRTSLFLYRLPSPFYSDCPRYLFLACLIPSSNNGCVRRLIVHIR